jgi:Rrf2 family nitric oxide-sensitive transcriptional repressor
VHGRSGGLKLARPADQIRLGGSASSPDAAVFSCIRDEAIGAFLATLDKYTLASIALKPKDFRRVLKADR